MSLEQFENELLTALKENNKKSTDIIKNNSKVINEYYVCHEDSKGIVKNFVEKLNNVILELKKYKIVTEVLNHSQFKEVLSEFRQSEILIKACQDNSRVNLIKWLLTMDINPSVQDAYGMTALMNAAQHYPMYFAVEALLKTRGKFIYLTDANGNNALFHSLQNKDVFSKMLKLGDFDLNHINNDNENIFLYACRNDRYKSFDKLLELNIDVNLVNNIGKTAAMYLVEHKRHIQLKNLCEKKKIDVNYRNKFGENLVTVFIKKFYENSNYYDGRFVYEGNYLAYKNYAITFNELIKLGCDFNVPIDSDGNTPIMFFLMTENYIAALYLLKKYPDIDLSASNIYGLNASMFVSTLKEMVFDELEYHKTRNPSISYKYLVKTLKGNKTYDSKYDNLDVMVQVKNRYEVSNFRKIINQWFLESLYPNSGATIIRQNQLSNSTNGSYIIY